MKYLIVMVFLILYSEQSQAITASNKFVVVIDRIEITGNTQLTSEQMAENLEIPIGQEIPAASSAELLSEAERKLRALGKFKPDFTIKLKRGEVFQHYVLEVNVEYISEWYKGFSGTAQYTVEKNLEYGNSLNYRVIGLNLFFGNRNINYSDWAADMELSDFYFVGESNYSDDIRNSRYTFGSNFSQLAFSLAKPSFFSNWLSTGGSIRLGHGNGFSKGDYSYIYKYGSDVYHSEYSERQKSRTYNLSALGFAGVKYAGFSFVGTYGRSMIKEYYLKNDYQEKHTKNGVEYTFENPSRSDAIDPPYYSGVVVLDFEWSQKSKISLVEPGCEASFTWKRNYFARGPEAPEPRGGIEYTFVLPSDVAVSPKIGYFWEYQYEDSDKSNLIRYMDISTKLEKFKHTGEVFYLDLSRSGHVDQFLLKKSKLSSNMKSKLAIGYKFASTDLVYDISAVYGDSTVEPWWTSLDQNDSYKRLGIR